MSTNDNDPATRRASMSGDAHGQAALMLVESLIHSLCANSILTVAQAIELTERAIDTQFHRSEEAVDGQAPDGDAARWQPHALLMSIAASLRTDGCGGSPHSA